jgi:opacity protein-like surface antigen
MKKRFWIGCLLGFAILCLGAVAASAQGEPEKITVATAEATIHAGPSAESQVIEKPAVGSVYEVVKKTGDWYEVKLPARLGMTITGFIHVKFLAKPAGEEQKEEAPAAAGAAQTQAYDAKRAHVSLGFLYQLQKGYDYAFSMPVSSTTLGIYDAVDGHSAFGFQAGAGYFVTNSVQIDLGFSYSSASPEGIYGLDWPIDDFNNEHGEASVDHTFSEMIFSLGLNYHFLHEGQARPYIGAGGSLISSKMEFLKDFMFDYTTEIVLTDPVLSEETVSTIGFYFKGGLDYLVSESIAVFGEARYAMAPQEDVPQPFLGEIEDYEDEVVEVDLGGFSAAFGVKFRF